MKSMNYFSFAVVNGKLISLDCIIRLQTKNFSQEEKRSVTDVFKKFYSDFLQEEFNEKEQLSTLKKALKKEFLKEDVVITKVVLVSQKHIEGALALLDLINSNEEDFDTKNALISSFKKIGSYVFSL